MSPGKLWDSVPSDKLVGVPPPTPPARPSNVLHDVSAGIGKVAGLPGQAVDLLNTGFATATSAISQALPCFLTVFVPVFQQKAVGIYDGIGCSRI